MATSKSGGSTQNGRDSKGRRLGCKMFDGQIVSGGEILVRQRGSKFYPGPGVGCGRDFTLFAKTAGIVKYKTGKRRKFVSVLAKLS